MLPLARPMMHHPIRHAPLIPKFTIGASAPKRAGTHTENRIDNTL